MDAHLDLSARLDPVTRHLFATAQIRGRTLFFLNGALAIGSCRSEGGSPVRWDEGGACNPYLKGVRLVRVGRAPRGDSAPVLAVDCAGALPEAVAEGANVVSSRVSELAVYLSWFPVPEDLGHVDRSLDLTLPAGWHAATNGVPAGRDGHWTSAPGSTISDLVVVASPQMSVTRVADGRCRVVLAGQVDAPSRHWTPRVSRALDLLATWYGPLSMPSPPLVVFTDRGGFPYSRIPAILMPGQRKWGRPLDEEMTKSDCTS